MSEKLVLSISDYLVFGMTLVISASIGLYFQVVDGKRKTNELYLYAGKNMSILPVALSLMATFMSAPTLMGIPAEMYVYGTNMVFMNIGFIVAPIITSTVFLPVYFSTGVSTAYEYLERRFGRSTRIIISVIFLITYVMYSGVTLYAPALALSSVTNLSLWTSVVSIGAVCIFYCTLGGMKAVLWTDVFQSILMYVCLFAIIIKGCLDLGGLRNIFSSAYDGGRILLPTFQMDFSTRYTMWSTLLQGLILSTYVYAANQIQVQRQLTLKNLKRSRMALLFSIPMLVVFQLLCCLCGLIFYAYYKSCDPLTSPTRPIHSPDQLMPYYVASTMKTYPGLPGLCIAGIFSASLSTLSSAVNSMAAVTYEDLVHPVWSNSKRSVLITKLLSVLYGVLSIAVAFIAGSMGNLTKAMIMIIGMVCGPTLAIYTLAVLTTTANEIGANLGVLAGFALAGCLIFIPNARFYPPLPIEKNCSESTNIITSDIILSRNATDISIMEPKSNLPDNFPVSFMWISTFSFLASIVIGFSCSWIISYFQGASKIVSPDLLSPVRQYFFQTNVAKKKTPETEVLMIQQDQRTPEKHFMIMEK